MVHRSHRSHRAGTRLAAVLLLGVVAFSCRTAPILNPHGTLSSSGQHTEADVAKAIKMAGLRYGWEMEETGPGLMTGTLHLRDHVAVVSIKYDTTSYEIDYKESQNLLHNAKRNTIHDNYNRWVNNLGEEIRVQLDDR
jgi:hypothetical protein